MLSTATRGVLCLMREAVGELTGGSVLADSFGPVAEANCGDSGEARMALAEIARSCS